MKLYKVLTKSMKGPFHSFQYEIGKTYHCFTFDSNPNIDCSYGFYATDVDGLIYSHKPNCRVFIAEVSGNHVEFDAYKRRYVNIRLVKEIKDIKGLVRRYLKTHDLGYDYYNALFPKCPLKGKPKNPNEKDIKILHEWMKISHTVSFANNLNFSKKVYPLVRISVGYSMEEAYKNIKRMITKIHDSYNRTTFDYNWYIHDTEHSIDDIIDAYAGSLFTDPNRYKGREKRPFVYKFISGVYLWERGLIPSFDGKVWRLHSGKECKIVYSEKLGY